MIEASPSQPASADDPSLHDDLSAAEVMTHDTASVSCPGKIVESRLREFDEAWNPQKSVARNDAILKLEHEDMYNDSILGQGSFSTAYQVFLRNPTTKVFDSDHRFAMKQLKPGIIADEYLFKGAVCDFALETKILANLSHENIITLHGVKSGDMIESLKSGEFFIVLDLLVETLDNRLARWQKKKNRRLFNARSEIAVSRRLSDVAIGIASGMEYLHANKIMFRDLKPANIGFDEMDRVKIFDFGLSREYSEDAEGRTIAKPRLMTGGTGTPRYMAPEVACMVDTYGFPADVYSFSILLWQIVTNRVPFASIKDPMHFASKVVQGSKRPNLKYVDCDQLKSLMETGWARDPAIRPTFKVMRSSLRKIMENRQSYRRLPGTGFDKRRRRRWTMTDPAAILRADTSRFGTKRKLVTSSDSDTVSTPLLSLESRTTTQLSDALSASGRSVGHRLEFRRRRSTFLRDFIAPQAQRGLTELAQRSQHSVSQVLAEQEKEDRQVLRKGRKKKKKKASSKSLRNSENKEPSKRVE